MHILLHFLFYLKVLLYSKSWLQSLEGTAVSKEENTKPAIRKGSSSFDTHDRIILSRQLTSIFFVYFLLSEIGVKAALR